MQRDRARVEAERFVEALRRVVAGEDFDDDVRRLLRREPLHRRGQESAADPLPSLGRGDQERIDLAAKFAIDRTEHVANGFARTLGEDYLKPIHGFRQQLLAARFKCPRAHVFALKRRELGMKITLLVPQWFDTLEQLRAARQECDTDRKRDTGKHGAEGKSAE